MTDMDLCKPRAYVAQLFYGNEAVGESQVVVLDFSAGRPAEASRDFLNKTMADMAERWYIRSRDYKHCRLELSDTGTREVLVVWRSYD